MATVDDIAKQSGVSRSTIFRFLRGNKVREDSRVLITRAMEDLDYDISRLTKAYQYNFEISVSAEYIHFTGFTAMIQGIMEVCEESNIQVRLVIRSDKQIDMDYNNWSKQSNTGVLVIGKNLDDELKEASYLSRHHIPHIFVNHKIELPGVNYVCTDLEQAAYEITTFLIHKGHQDILMSCNSTELLVDQLKLNGYKRALLDHGIPINNLRIIDEKDMHKREDRIKQLFINKDIPQAYFGICDSKAIKFINTARNYGYNVPDDISVVGMDDIDMARYHSPAVTSVAVPFQQLGNRAAEMLICLMRGDFKNVRAVMAHELVYRDSVTDKIHR